MQLGFWPKEDNVTDSINRPNRGNSLSQMVELTCARLLREFGLHSPQHGGVGITFPIVAPRGRSSKFPWRGTSQVTYVTMVPRVGIETLRPLGFGAMLRTQASDEEADDVFARPSLYCGRAGSDVMGCRRPTDGVFSYVSSGTSHAGGVPHSGP